MSKANVSIVHQTTTGLNDRVRINGNVYTNTQAYNKAKHNEVSGFHGVKNSSGTKFIRSNPDKSKSNNLDK